MRTATTKTTTTKLLAIVMALTLVLSLLPGVTVPARAAGTVTDVSSFAQLQAAAASGGAGDTVRLTADISVTVAPMPGGNPMGEAVLAIGRDLTIDLNGKALLMANYDTTPRNVVKLAPGVTLNIIDNAGGGELEAVNTGLLTTKSSGFGAGINNTGATLNIYGGTVTAKGGTGIGNGAGIGGGSDQSGGTVNIYGGAVTATGGPTAAGIGGGSGQSGGVINIYGGSVTAIGGSDETGGAGIGGGGGDIGGSSGVINIYGGAVTATGGSVGINGSGGGAGIGGGGGIVGGGYVGALEVINIFAKVEATGGASSGSGGGAGIGGGGGANNTSWSPYGEGSANIASGVDISGITGGVGLTLGDDIGNGGGSTNKKTSTKGNTIPAPTGFALAGFMAGGVRGVVSASGDTVTVALPAGTDISALTPTFWFDPATSAGASAWVLGSGGFEQQVSGVSARDFSAGPVVYMLNPLSGAHGVCFVTVYTAAPEISGPTAMTLSEGYAAAESGAFTVAGTPAPTVSVSADSHITWDGAAKKLSVAPGLPAGVYPVTLTAELGSAPTASATFTLTVAGSPAPPELTGPTMYRVAEGYAETHIGGFELLAYPAATVTVSDDTNFAYDIEKNELIAYPGLAAGNHYVTLTASNDISPDATLQFALDVISSGFGVDAGISRQPSNRAVPEGQSAVFSCVAYGDTPAYRWQVDKGLGFADVTDGTGGNTAIYTTPATTAAMNGWTYRVIVGSIPYVTSDAATLTVNPPAAPPDDFDFLVTGPYVLPSAGVGYGAQTPYPVTVSNNSTAQSTKALMVNLVGADAQCFEITDNTLGVLAPNGSATFNVAPREGLAAGTYTATIAVVSLVPAAAVTIRSVGVSFTVDETPAQSYTMGRDNYSFSNSYASFGYSPTYQIPVARYEQLYSSADSLWLYNNLGAWGGSCFGFSTTDTLFYGKTLSTVNYGQSSVYSLPAPNDNTASKKSLRELMELYQISQFAYSIGNRLEVNTNNTAALVAAVDAFKNGGPGVIVCVYGKEGGHAIVAYDITDTGSEYKLSIYDNNWPDSTRTLTIGYGGAWSYTLWDGLTFGPRAGDEISFIKANNVQEVAGKAKVAGGGTVNMLMNMAVPDGTAIHNGDGDDIDQIVGAFRHIPLNLMQGAPAPTVLLYSMPMDEYTADGNQASFSGGGVYFDMSSNDPAATLTGKAGTDGFAQINSATSAGFTIQYSTDATASKPLTLTGTASGDFKLEANGDGLWFTGSATFTASDVTGSKQYTVTAGQRTNVTYIMSNNGNNNNGNNGGATNYTVTFNSNGGSSVQSQSVASGGKVTKPADPVKDGLYFAGWYKDAALTQAYDFSAAVTGNITLYAKWTETAPKPWNNPFTDVHEDDWFYGNVKFVYENGLMNGTGANTFSPNTNLTRGMVVTILYRYAGEPSAAGLDNPFSDVASSQYYTDAVKWAAANKIVSGYGNGLYGPNDPVTREQLAAIIYRYAVFMGKGPVGAWLVNLPFEDKDKISGYATEAVTWCYMSGIVNGKPGNLFDPQGTATRAEVAAMVHRFVEAVK